MAAVTVFGARQVRGHYKKLRSFRNQSERAKRLIICKLNHTNIQDIKFNLPFATSVPNGTRTYVTPTGVKLVELGPNFGVVG